MAIVARPLSPAISPRASPAPISPCHVGHNLKVHDGTQPADIDNASVSQHILDELDAKLNRRSVPLMRRDNFDELVAATLRESREQGISLETALAERLRHCTHELGRRLEDMKRTVFLDPTTAQHVDHLLPFVRQETSLGWTEYIIHTLSVLSAQPPPPTSKRCRPPTPSSSSSSSSSPAISRPRPTKQPRRHSRIQKSPTNPKQTVRRSNRIRDIGKVGVL